MVNSFLVIATVPRRFEKGVPRQRPGAQKGKFEYPPSRLQVSSNEIAEVARLSPKFGKLVSQYRRDRNSLIGLEFAHSWLKIRKRDGTLMSVKKIEFRSDSQIEVTWPLVQAVERDLPPRVYKEKGPRLHTQRNRKATAARTDRTEVIRIAPRRAVRQRQRPAAPARDPSPVDGRVGDVDVRGMEEAEEEDEEEERQIGNHDNEVEEQVEEEQVEEEQVEEEPVEEEPVEEDQIEEEQTGGDREVTNLEFLHRGQLDRSGPFQL